MAPYFSRKTTLSFGEVIARVEQTLKQQGFDIVSFINLQNVLRNNLSIAFRKYQIIGACIPYLAYGAVTLESHTGVVLQSNIVIQEHENGEVEVSAFNPLEAMDLRPPLKSLEEINAEINEKLRRAIDAIQYGSLHKDHPEVMPEYMYDEHPSYPIPV